MALSYQTVIFRLMKPTAHKREALRQAQQRYSRAFEWLLRGMKPRAQEGETQCPAALLAGLDQFEAGPFKDALRQEVQGLLRGYQRRRAEQPGAPYPITRTEDADLQAILQTSGHFSSFLYCACLKNYQKIRPIVFCRYDASRDFSLLRSHDGNRYYARLTLFDKNHAVAAGGEEKGLADVQTGAPFSRRGKTRRELLFPLLLGKWQKQRMLGLEGGRCRAKSAQLFEKNGKFYLAVHLWRCDPPERRAQGTLGVCRGEWGRVYCCRRLAGAEESFVIEERQAYGPARVHLLARRLLEAAGDCRLVFENFKAASDGLAAYESAPMPAEEYGLLCRIAAERAAAGGMPKPVEVSPLTIFRRCPHCGALKRGMVDRGVFLCTVCGASEALGPLGARNLAQTLDRYEKNKISVRVTKKGDSLFFACPALKITLETPDGPEAAEYFLKHVEKLLESGRAGEPGTAGVYRRLRNVNLREKFNFI